MATLFSQGYTGDIAFDKDGVPNGVSNVVEAGIVEGITAAITDPLSASKFYTGMAKTVKTAVQLGAAVAGTAKFTTGKWIPSKAF